jgi:hypothetical protein
LKQWADTVEVQDLGSDDREKASTVKTYDAFSEFLQEAIDSSPQKLQSNYLGHIQLIMRPLRVFINKFEQLIAPLSVDMSILWGLLYLTVKVWLHISIALDALSNKHFQLALGSDENLKRISACLTSLRREIALLNGSVANCEDDNFVRTEMIEIFDPLLQILVGLIKFQHSHSLGEHVSRYPLH